MFIKPITDRTQIDVDYAKTRLQAIKVELMNYNVEELKGCLNISDLNRIETNLSHIASNLNNLNYTVNIQTKQWDMQSVPKQSDINRILNNLRILTIAFHTILSVPTKMTHFEDINTLENSIEILNNWVSNSNKFKRCGKLTCGNGFKLPIKGGV